MHLDLLYVFGLDFCIQFCFVFFFVFWLCSFLWIRSFVYRYSICWIWCIASGSDFKIWSSGSRLDFQTWSFVSGSNFRIRSLFAFVYRFIWTTDLKLHLHHLYFICSSKLAMCTSYSCNYWFTTVVLIIFLFYKQVVFSLRERGLELGLLRILILNNPA